MPRLDCSFELEPGEVHVWVASLTLAGATLAGLRACLSPDEVAKAALFLASSDSSHTTGESLNVSGGRLMS